MRSESRRVPGAKVKGHRHRGTTKAWETLAAVAAFSGLCSVLVRADYEAVEVKESGTIVGIVRFEGKAPKQKRVTVSTNDEPCHEEPIPTESLVVSKDGKIRWAVASIKKIDKGKPFPEEDPDNPIILDQRGCRFRPHVVVVPKDRRLSILNSDGIMHNVHVFARKNEPFNRSMPGRLKVLEATFDMSERIRVGCDVHRWMGAWIVVSKHPYYAVSDKDGAFRLEDVPAGTFTVRVWHEELGKQEKQVTITPGADAQVEFVFKKR